MRAFTIIYHHLMKDLMVSFSEYVFLDMIYHYQNNPGGWAYGSKENYAEAMTMTRQGVQKIIRRLRNKGLLERQSNYSQYLRLTKETTKRFVNAHNIKYGRENNLELDTDPFEPE